MCGDLSCMLIWTRYKALGNQMASWEPLLCLGFLFCLIPGPIVFAWNMKLWNWFLRCSVKPYHEVQPSNHWDYTRWKSIYQNLALNMESKQKIILWNMRPKSGKRWVLVHQFKKPQTNKPTGELYRFPMIWTSLPARCLQPEEKRRGKKCANTKEEQTKPKGKRVITVLNVINQGKLLKHVR